MWLPDRPRRWGALPSETLGGLAAACPDARLAGPPMSDGPLGQRSVPLILLRERADVLTRANLRKLAKTTPPARAAGGRADESRNVLHETAPRAAVGECPSRDNGGGGLLLRWHEQGLDTTDPAIQQLSGRADAVETKHDEREVREVHTREELDDIRSTWKRL